MCKEVLRITAFLKSMIEECELIFQFNEKVPEDRNLGKSIEDTMLFRAIAVSEQRIGEASAQIMNLTDGKIAQLYPAIPWKDIKGLRNHFVHEYLSIDEAIIINTAIDDIPALYPMLRNLLIDIEAEDCNLEKLIQ